jgi:alkanesulfonate monooxygenase SsuD/methylene tetrahydromethanopterin reductase-like flavin-dependent oxidoreductase (luciferase family)
MTRFGYTLMTEQSGPKDLVDFAVRAEGVGFEFEVMSDHYFPWLSAQGHAPYAWSVLGAVAHATERVDLMTYVTCPTLRYHPAVVAQKAATVQLLADGRFTLGLGSGENLNDLVDHQGEYYQVDSARIWDLPEDPVEIAVAVAGERAVEELAPLADHLIAVEPLPDVVQQWNATEGAPTIGSSARAVGQIPICWDPEEKVAVERAHDQFRWFAGGWSVNADLPTTAGFAAATQFVRPEDVADNIPCGPDLDAIVEAVKPFWEAGFTDVALVQVGGDSQEQFLAEAAEPLLAKLREASS